APASRAFSISSLAAEAGRSTTSPAAIKSATWRSSSRIFGMGSSFPLHQLHDAEGQGVDNHVQADGGPDGIGLFIGPAQGDSGGEIGDRRQQHGLGVIEQKILPDV